MPVGDYKCFVALPDLTTDGVTASRDSESLDKLVLTAMWPLCKMWQQIPVCCLHGLLPVLKAEQQFHLLDKSRHKLRETHNDLVYHLQCSGVVLAIFIVLCLEQIKALLRVYHVQKLKSVEELITILTHYCICHHIVIYTLYLCRIKRIVPVSDTLFSLQAVPKVRL